jgi:hypothetical protein
VSSRGRDSDILGDDSDDSVGDSNDDMNRSDVKISLLALLPRLT